MSGLYAVLLAVSVAAYGFYLYSPVPEGAMGEDWRFLSIVGVFGKISKPQMWMLQTLGNGEWMAQYMRLQMKAFGWLAGSVKNDAVKFTDEVYAGVPVRVYIPDVRRGNGAVMYMHGGGWVIGSVADSHPLLMEFAEKLQRVVVSIEYRLAPEHPYPAGPDDCETAVRHFLEKAYSGVQVDPKKVVVAGDSAGGNLAAVVANRLHGKPAKYPLKGQILIYPVTQMTDFLLNSYRQGHAIELAGNATLLTTMQMSNFYLSYMSLPIKYNPILLANQHIHKSLFAKPQFKLLDPASIPSTFRDTPIKNADKIDLSFLEKGLNQKDVQHVQEFMKTRLLNSDINPLYYENLKGVPPAYVITCGFDVLRDEGIMYVNRLREARVPTVWKHYPSAIHAIFSLTNTELGVHVMSDMIQYLNGII